MRRICSLVLFAVVVVSGLACQSVPVEDPAPARTGPPLEELPWTTAFGVEAVLLAEDVWIEGPPGLLGHVVVTQNSRDFDHSVETVESGLLQQARVKPELAGMAATTWTPLRAQLDNLIIAPTHRIRVLERFEDADVIVRARGRVVWRRVDGSDEKRGRELELRGRRGD